MNEINPVMRVEKIVKTFGGLRAVDGADMHLRNNEILGLIGPNGAGKTTLFNIISGTLSATSGRIYLFDKLISRPRSNKMAELGIGRTYQIVKPFSTMTVLENTMVGAFVRTNSAAHAREKACEVLEQLEFTHKANVQGKSLGLLDLKRLEIARALATSPSILLLDEVMAGLNPEARERMMETIRGIQMTGMSIIIIEHVMKAIMGLSERIYVLNQGAIIAEGTPTEISENELVIQSYLGEKKYA